MRKSELNKVLEVIKKNDLNPTDFDFQNTDTYLSVTYKGTKLQFHFKSNPKAFQEFTYAHRIYEADYRMVVKDDKWLNITDALRIFDTWIKDNVLEYLEEENLPDPLEEIRRQEDSVFEVIGDEDSGFFNETEKDRVQNSFQEFKKLLFQNYKIDEATKSYVDKQIEYAINASERLSKRDFKAVAIKILYDVGISIGANLIVEGGKAMVEVGRLAVGASIPPLFWNLVREAFKYFIQ